MTDGLDSKSTLDQTMSVTLLTWTLSPTSVQHIPVAQPPIGMIVGGWPEEASGIRVSFRYNA